MSYDYSKLDRELDRTKSKVFLSKSAAFLGPLMCSLDFVWSTDNSIHQGTAATNGVKIWWHPDDFLGCTIEGRISTLLHELAHVWRLHGIRIGNRCPKVWNAACDIAINRELRKEGYQLDNGHWPVPGMPDHPEIPFELEEEIYDFLNAKGGSGMPGSGSTPGNTSGNAVPGAPGHTCGGLVPLQPGQKQQLINSVVKAVHSAQLSNAAGSIPGSVELILDKFLKPKVPWEQALYLWFNDLLEEDFSWRRPNRRYQDMYLPARITEEGRLEHLHFYWDVSGSISDDDALRFNSEVKYIKDTFNPLKLTLVQFDCVIQKIDEFDDTTPFDRIKVVGRGGTDLRPVREHIMKEQPTAAVIFSDLYCNPMEEGPECPIIWICVNQPNATVPFGTLIHVK
jgi:predicted metal-dependent peptidase